MKKDGISVSIRCCEGPLSEYATKEEPDRTMTCYIASKSGENFDVWFQNELDTGIAITIQFDGVHFNKRGWVFSEKITQYIRGVYISTNELRKFVFSDLKVTDDEALAAKARSLEDIGTIKVQLRRCILGERKPYTVNSCDEEDEHKQEPLHEKTKKAGSHIVTLGPAENSSPRMSRDVDYIDAEDGPPFLQFVWRYRPKEMLQAQGIIALERAGRSGPRRRSASPAQTDDQAKRRRTDGNNPNNNDSASQAGPSGTQNEPDPQVKEEEEAEWDELMAEQAVLAARIQEARSRRVKREPSPIRLSAGGAGEVIDLTLD